MRRSTLADAVEYARFADDLVVLVDYHPRHQWLRGAIAKRLREEISKLGVEVNEEKTRVVDLVKGESLDFLVFKFGWVALVRENRCRCVCRN